MKILTIKIILFGILTTNSIKGDSSFSNNKLIAEEFLEYFVTPKEGLVLREGPGKKYKKIITIPYMSLISSDIALTEPLSSHKQIPITIDSKNYYWKYVKYKKKQGFVLEYYLSKINPQFKENFSNKLCSINNSIYIGSFDEDIMYIKPFYQKFDINFPCILTTDKVDVRHRVRNVHVSGTGKWLVITGGTSPIGILKIYLIKDEVKFEKYYSAHYSGYEPIFSGENTFKFNNVVDCEHSKEIIFKDGKIEEKNIVSFISCYND